MAGGLSSREKSGRARGRTKGIVLLLFQPALLLKVDSLEDFQHTPLAVHIADSHIFKLSLHFFLIEGL
jgi:hypothetical protein